QAKPVLQIMVPDRLVPFEQRLAAPDVVDQNVEAALFGADARDEGAYFIGHEVIGRDGDALAAERGHEFGALFDRLRALVFGGSLPRRPSGDIDGGAGRAEFRRDAAPGAARRPRDQGDLAVEILRHVVSPWFAGSVAIGYSIYK